MSRVGVFFLITALISVNVFSNPICQVEDFKQFTICITKNHLEYKKNELSLTQGDGVESAGSAYLNPEVDFETTQGRFLGEKIGSNRFMVSYPFQVFGQRITKKEKAKAEADLLRIEGLKGQNGLIAEATLNMYRLRQIKEEIKILEDALSAYSKVINQLARRAQLSPEQEVILGVFKLAVGDLSFRKENLISRRRSVEDFFTHIPDLSKQEIEKHLPDRKQNWPELTHRIIDSNGWPIREVETRLRLAQADFDVSKAETWPVIKAGVVYQQGVQGSYVNDQYGVAISFPIPLFNTNSGNRQVALAVFQKSKIEKELAYKEVTNERMRLVELYKASTEAFKKSPKDDEISKRYRHLESKYANGLISSSLLIEAHRQRYDFKTSQNEIEITALQALFRIYEMDGTSFEDVL